MTDKKKTEQVKTYDKTGNYVTDASETENNNQINENLDGMEESCVASESVETAETVKTEMLDRIKRLQADFDNYRRRTRQEQCDLGAFVTQNLIKELLPIIDNFERALASRPVEDPSGFGSGVEMIYRQFYAILEKQGISAVEAVGTQFDPARHEAIMTEEGSDQPEGTVVEELQKGYEACGKLLRPALVKVAGK
jgi:molecular chaperone GrpE